VIKDIEFITKNPNKFATEVFLMTILPSLALLYVIYSRTGKVNAIFDTETIILAIKFASLHILLQTSGYYRYAFA
jgi:hypothetical protein